ncbi:MAG: hypothetical protein DME26_18630 [Verrucomicrobia bacterium]|nr:MAG: hypothetical protein DME26_18630 [Verrucomicrobiota bacterium]
MNLPNYFLADLPPDAAPTPLMIREACQTLKRNREQYLAGRPTESLIHTLSNVAENWLRPDYPFRVWAMEHSPAMSGFPSATLANGLDSFFKQLTPENLHALFVQDLGHAQRLNGMTATSAEQRRQLASMANGAELLVHITAGSLPNPTLMSIVLGLLVRSAQFVKCASGTSLVPRLFAHSVYEAEPKLGACLEIAEWPGGRIELEEVLFSEANGVTATGRDQTLSEIRRRVPLNVRFLGYGDRLSFGYVAHEAWACFSLKAVISRAATDIIAWNQLGCLSPHVLYVEHGGLVSAELFAEMLAEELQQREETEPRGPISIETAATIAARRDFYEIRAAHSGETRCWKSSDSTAWTVVYETEAQFQVSCLHRFIYVKGVTNLPEALRAAGALQGKVSTVGIAAPDEKAEELANQLARWGVSRVCPLGRMQSPPLTWRHDGRPSLGDLVMWTDWEQ